MKCPDCGTELDPNPLAHKYYMCPKCEEFWELVRSESVAEYLRRVLVP